MDASLQIEKFKDFFEAHHEKDIAVIVQKGLKSIIVDFALLSQFDVELAEALLEDPEELIRAAELALTQFDVIEKSFLENVRFRNLPASQYMKISEIRSKDLGAFLEIEGIVRQASDVRPQVTSAKFECAGCGNTISILQIDSKFKEPTRCTCGMRGRFKQLSQELVDAQHLKIEEAPDSLDGGEQPKRLSVFLKEDLVEPKMERKCSPGSKVRIIGIVKEIPVLLKTGAKSVRFDLILEANNIESAVEDYSDIEISNEEIEEIKSFARKPKVFERFAKSIAPSIYGHEKIKGALVLQMFGGNRRVKPDGTTRRGDIHVLLCGDPGAGKSQLITFIAKAAPKSRYVSGHGASGAGLCIAPDSLVTTNPGGIHEIKDLVESKLKNNSKIYRDGIWCAEDTSYDKKVFTLDDDLKVKPSQIAQFWRISPPDYMIKLVTTSKKEVIVTPNTKLMSLENGEIVWKESEFLNEGEYLAGSRVLKFENNKEILSLDLIKSNPIVLGIKDEIKKVIESLCLSRKVNIRQLAKELKINENKLYFHWVNERARGNITLNDLLNLVNLASYDLNSVAKKITFFSLRKGHKFKLPVFLNEDFMYFAGLIAGDGDLCESNGSYSIRFSNNSKELQKIFSILVKRLFCLNCNLSSEKSELRAESWRFSSKVVFEILNSLGLPKSPKSHRIDLNNVLLSLPNNLVANFLCGYFDADGGPVFSETSSKTIEVTTCSKNFAKKLQLVLLRFEIQSNLRLRKTQVSQKKNGVFIKPNYVKYVLTISGRENLEKFNNSIGFKSPLKVKKLKSILDSLSSNYTNYDVVPGVHSLIKILMEKYNLTSKQVFGYKTSNYFSGNFEISIFNLRKIVNKLSLLIDSDDMELINLKQLANSDIVWEKIIKMEKIFDHGYEFVYDFTIEGSHNFLVNGLVVHNTAAVVKDEFLKGWALEAGTMALAHKGIAIVDELDKMSHEDRNALHSALEQQIITIAKANIQACYSADTEVLTELGWKLYSDVGDLRIATYDINSKSIKFMKHNGLFVYDYKGKMFHFKNRRVDVLVTPDHKMLYKEIRHKEFMVAKAEDINYNLFNFLNSGNYSNSEEEYFILPPITHSQNRKNLKYTHQHKAKKIPMDLWLEFLGYFLSEGGFETNPTIGISQKHGKNSDKIRRCLLKFSKLIGHSLTQIKNEKYTWFKITSTQLSSFLKANCGGRDYKKNYPLNFSSLSQRQLKILFNSLMLGDGSSDGKAYGSTSLSLINLFQALACLIGKSASLHIQYPEGYRGRRKMYRITLSDKINPMIYNSSISKINYNGKVFCFSTKTGFFITRRNGKISIQGNTLNSQTTLLAAANPKLGRFDPYTPIAGQINLPPSLLNRFDLIFPVRDLPSKENDEKIASHVLESSVDDSLFDTEVSVAFMKKYVSYAKQKINPKLTKGAINEIKDFYVKLRNSGSSSEDKGVKPIPISARQLEGLMRLSEASAKIRLDDKVRREDALCAIELLRSCLMDVGFDPETGMIDIDRMSSTITASVRGKIGLVKEIINALESKGMKIIPIEEIIAAAALKGIDDSSVEEAIEKLKRSGDLFEPKKGHVSKI